MQTDGYEILFIGSLLIAFFTGTWISRENPFRWSDKLRPSGYLIGVLIGAILVGIVFWLESR